MKKMVTVAGGVLAVLAIAALVIPSMIDLDKYKAAITARIKAATGRDVDFSHIGLTVFTGIGAEIENLKIAENPKYGHGDFISAKGIQLRVQLLPLLNKQVKIKKIIIKEPSVFISRNAEGIFNFSDIMARKGKSAGSADGQTAPRPSFIIKILEITDGAISYRDEKYFPKGELKFHELKADITNLSLTEPVTIAASGRLRMQNAAGTPSTEPAALDIKTLINFDFSRQHLAIDTFETRSGDGTITLKGEIDGIFKDQKWDCAAKFDSIDAVQLLSLLPGPSKLPKKLTVQGPLTADMATSGSREKFTLSSDIRLDEAKLDYGGTFVKPSGTKFHLSLKSNVQGREFTIQSADLALAEASAHADGTIEFEQPSPQININVRAYSIPLESTKNMIGILDRYSPSGTITGDVAVSGALNNLEIKVRGASKSLGFAIPPSKEAQEAAKARSGSIADLKSFITLRKTETVRADGTVTASRGAVSEILFDTVLLEFNYAPDALVASNFSFNALGGAVKADASYQTAKKEWKATAKLTSIDVNKAASTTTNYRDTFAGTLGALVRANGTAGKEMQKSLSAEGSVTLVKGEWKNFNLVDSIIDKLFGIQGVSGLVTSFEGEAAKHESTRFDSLDASFTLKENRLQVREANLKNIQTSKATDSSAVMDGTVDLATKKLDLAGKVILSERHSENLAGKADVLRALLNSEKKMVLPVTVGGTVAKPLPFLDTEYVTKAVSQYYIQKSLGKGVEKLQKKLGTSGTGKNGGSGVQQLLDGLFKKK